MGNEMAKPLKEIPEFATEDEEFEFWSTHDSTDYIDPKSWKRVPAPHVPRTPGLLNFQMTADISDEVVRLARELKIPVQELVQQLLATGLEQLRLRLAA